MSKELSFPGYFGGTFDAFEECFRDLAWLSDEHIVIHIRGLDSVAARNPCCCIHQGVHPLLR